MSAPSATGRPTPGRPSLSALTGALLVGGLALALAQTTLPLSDADTLWHLVLGRRLAETGSFVLPREGLLTTDYLYNQWLPELVAAQVESVWGLAGVAVLAHIARAAILTATFLLARRWAGPLPSAAITLAVLVAGLGAFTARPQLIGLLAMLAVVSGWRSTAADGRARWWVLGIGAIWAASHGSWLIGVAVGGVTVVGMALRRRSVKGLRAPALLVAGCLAVGVALPPGARWPEELRAVRDVSWFADEWQPPALSSPHLLALLALAAVAVVGLIRARTSGDRRADPVDLLTLALALGLGLSAYRGLAFAAALLVPLAAALPRRRAAAAPARAEVVVLCTAMLATIALAIATAPRVAGEPARVPLRLSSALAALPPGTVVANDPALGGWLLWSRPELVPVLDTRLEAYGSAHLRAVGAAYGLEEGWSAQLDAWHAGAALVTDTAPLAAALVASSGWREVGRDAGYVLLVPPGR